MVETKTKASWRYGRFDIRAKLPVAKGMWPAIWMMPDKETYGWPKDGEIDIMELISQQPDLCYGTIHCGISGTDKYWHPTATCRLESGNFYDAYHLFSMEWEPGVIRMYMDQHLYATYTDWESWVTERGAVTPQTPLDFPHPFNALFYLNLNLATGGSWCESTDETTDWENAVMSVDYVRVYKAVDRVYRYQEEAFQSSVNRQGPIWYAQKQSSDAGRWENMTRYSEGEGWREEGILITNESISCGAEDGAVAFVVPEEGYVEVRLAREAVSDKLFELKITKGGYFNVDSSFSEVRDTLVSWKALLKDGRYYTDGAAEGIVISAAADDVLRLEVHAEGTAVQNVAPIISYKKAVQISFNGNGGHGTLPQVIHTGAGARVTVPQCGLVKDGYLFNGWSCGDEIYQPGNWLKPEKDEILTAVWKKKTEQNPKSEVKTPPQKPKLALKKAGNKVKLTWKKVTDADGYEISMKIGKGKYKVIARKGKAAKSYKKTVRNKKTVYFRIRAYKNTENGKLYGKYSAVKKVKP